ncbi:MAG: hypothetical protein FJ090_10245 [Deltaproteobacteria bacterium]|nr:hypothetical protein [Deltaproteobacteria bacterium]
MLMALLGSSALAQDAARGVVVRLDTGGERLDAPVVAVLTPKDGGAAIEIALNDGGTAPDVSAGDNSWSGSASVAADAVSVVLKAGAKSHDGGTVSWSADDRFRELSVSLAGGAIKIDAAVAAGEGGGGSGSGGPTGSVTGEPPLGDMAGGGSVGPTGSATGEPPLGDVAGGGSGGTSSTPFGSTAPGARPSAVSFPTGGAEPDPGLFIGLGVGLLLLVGVAWLWVRTRQHGKPHETTSFLEPLPEPAVVGKHTPSLSDGLSLWVADADTTTELLEPLLATLAQNHRVLVVGPAALRPPSVHGGPVYRASKPRPNLAADTADALLREPGAPLAVLIVIEIGDVNTLRDFADMLPDRLGGVVLSRQDVDVPWPKVTVTRDGELFVFASGGGKDCARSTPRGLEVA